MSLRLEIAVPLCGTATYATKPLRGTFGFDADSFVSLLGGKYFIHHGEAYASKQEHNLGDDILRGERSQGSRLALMGPGSVQVVDKDNKGLLYLNGIFGRLSSFSKDGKSIAVLRLTNGSRYDHQLEIWDVASRRRRLLFRTDGVGPDDDYEQRAISEVSISPDGSRIAVAQNGGTVTLYDAANGRLLRRFETGGGLHEKIRFSPDGKLLLASNWSKNSHFIVVDSQSGEPRHHFVYPARHAFGMQASPDGTRLLLAMEGGAKIVSLNRSCDN